MIRCPVCKNRGGLEYGCIGDACEFKVCDGDCGLKECYHCVDCGSVALSQIDVNADAFGDLEDAFDGALGVEDILSCD